MGRALGDGQSSGVLSRSLYELTPQEQALVIGSVRQLPPEIGLLSLRELVPIMASLEGGRQLNLLTAEAVAAAVVLDAIIAVTTESALLTATCSTLGIDVRHVTP